MQRVAVSVVSVLVGVTIAYVGAFAIYVTALLAYDDFGDEAAIRGSVRTLGVVAMLVAPVATFRLLRTRGTALYPALLLAGGVGLVIALPLAAWGVLTLSDFDGLD